MDAERKGVWAIVHCFNQKFIGCISAIRDASDKKEELTKDVILGADWVCLSPVYEYFSPIRPVQVQGPNGQPAMAMTRDQLTMPFENFLHDTSHWTRPTGIDFFEDMHKDDRAQVERFIDQVNKQRLETRAKATGLVLAGDIPGPKGHRG